MQIKAQDWSLQAKPLESTERSKPNSPPAGSNGAGLQAQIGERVAAARQSIEEMSGALVDRARNSATATNRYVHAQPWKAVGIGAAVGATLGVVVGLLLRRRATTSGAAG